MVLLNGGAGFRAAVEAIFCLYSLEYNDIMSAYTVASNSSVWTFHVTDAACSILIDAAIFNVLVDYSETYMML